MRHERDVGPAVDNLHCDEEEQCVIPAELRALKEVRALRERCVASEPPAAEYDGNEDEAAPDTDALRAFTLRGESNKGELSAHPRLTVSGGSSREQLATR